VGAGSRGSGAGGTESDRDRAKHGHGGSPSLDVVRRRDRVTDAGGASEPPAGGSVVPIGRQDHQVAGGTEQRPPGPEPGALLPVFSPRFVRAAWVAGPIAIAAITILGWQVVGSVDYLRAWAAAGAVFFLPTLVTSVVVVRRVDRLSKVFWLAWLAALCGGALLGLSMLLEPLAPGSTHLVGAVGILAGGLVWGIGIVYLVGRTDGARVLLVDGLELLAAGLAVVAPVLVAAGPSLAHANAQWFVIPGTVTAAALPLVAVMTLVLCVRLPAHQRAPEVFGVFAAVVGEVDAVLLLVDAVHGFHLLAGPLLLVQALTQWLVLMVALNAHRSYPEGLDRLGPEAQVRRRSPIPLFVAVGVPALAVEAATASPASSWTVPVVVAVLGALAFIMTGRHLLVVAETRRLYGLLAGQAEQRRRLLGDLVRSVEHDRHRVLAQLHELAVEMMGAIGAVVRVVRSSSGGGEPVVVGALDRIYADVNARAETLRRLMHAVRPDERTIGGITTETLATAIAASTASTFMGTRVPQVEVDIASDLRLDWMTSMIVYQIVAEALYNAYRRSPVSEVHVSLKAEGGGLRLVVVDDAAGTDLLSTGDAPWLTTLQLFADLGRGTVEVETLPGGGARTSALLGARA
jgi:signal transduction histidine kinase